MGIIKDILNTAIEISIETPTSIIKDDINSIFGDVKPNKKIVGCLDCISESIYNKYMMRGGAWFEHARHLTKQEIDELI